MNIKFNILNKLYYYINTYIIIQKIFHDKIKNTEYSLLYLIIHNKLSNVNILI